MRTRLELVTGVAIGERERYEHFDRAPEQAGVVRQMNQQLAQVPAMFVGFEQPIAGAAGQYPFDRIQGGFRRGRSGVDEGAMHQRIEGDRMPERASGREEARSDGNGGAPIMQ